MTETHNELTDQHHYELTVESLISKEMLQERGYRSVKAHELPPAFAEYQRRDGLLIPIRSVRGEIESYQLKPDTPRVGKNGKPIKYETAANAKQIIDCPPSARRLLNNPKATLIITEGAKKVDSSVSAGLWTTIGLQGVYGWRGTNDNGGTMALSDWEDIALNGREVVIAFDSDVMTKETVRSALDRLAGFLTSRKAHVHYLVLPNLPDGSKCGLDDFFAQGRKPTELDQYLVDELPPLTALASPEVGSVPRANVLRMSEVEAKEIDWLWQGWIPNGMLSLLGGYAGDGKSTLTTSLIASLTTGAPLPDGSTAPITNCLILPAEDDVAHVVKPRLAIHDADMDRVHVLQTVDAGDGTERLLNLRTDIPIIAQVVREREIGLIVIDPISGFTPKADRNNEGEVRDNLQQLIPLMEEHQCAVLGVMHIGKNSGHARAFQALMGSTAYTAVARSVLMLSALPTVYQVENEPRRNVLGVAKSNYAEAPQPIQYHRRRDEAIEYLGPSPVGLDTALNAKAGNDDEEKGPNQTEKAEAWLLDFMDGKPVLASAVEAAAKEEGIARNTLQRAKKQVGIASSRENNLWYWLPPRDESTSAA